MTFPAKLVKDIISEQNNSIVWAIIGGQYHNSSKLLSGDVPLFVS